MPDIFVPPIQPGLKFKPIKGISKTVTNTAAFLIGTAAASQVECAGVVLQSSALNDSDAAVTANMYVVSVNDSNALIYELDQGEVVFIPCSNTSQLKIKTQSGTAWVRGFVVAYTNG